MWNSWNIHFSTTLEIKAGRLFVIFNKIWINVFYFLFWHQTNSDFCLCHLHGHGCIHYIECLLSPCFLKKSEGYIVIASVRLSVRLSVMLSPPKPLGEIQPNFVCEITHMNGACNGKNLLSPAPWGPGEGSKGQISFNFNFKVNFKDFYTKLCACSHKWKIQKISEVIFILSPG